MDESNMYIDPIKRGQNDNRSTFKKSNTAPILARWFSGGLRAAESKLRRSLSNFYISKVVWVPKQDGCYVHFGNVKDCQQAIRAWNKVHTRSRAYGVEGCPFVEDLTSRRPSSILHVQMKNGCLTQEELFSQMRRFGKLRDVTLDEAKSSSRVNFSRITHANAARNCLDGKEIDNCILDISYIPISWKIPIDLITSPRAIVPIAATTFVAFTALVTPIRLYFVAQRLTVEKSIDWKPEVQNTYVLSKATPREIELREWIEETPTNALLIVGPKGTDKTTLINKVLQRRFFSVRIDCSKVESVQDFVDCFVRDIGFRPSFAAFNHLFFVLFSSFIPNATQASHDTQILSVLNTLNRVFVLPKTTSKNAVIVFDEFDQFLKILHSENKEEIKRAKTVLHILANWVQTTTTRGRAHIIFISNSGFAHDTISMLEGFKSLPTMWIQDISDKEAQEYLKANLTSLRGPNSNLLTKIPDVVNLLGGRLGDLDHLIFQISHNHPIDKATFQMLEDAKVIVRQHGFGSSIFDSNAYAWTQPQLWRVMKLLYAHSMVPYDKVLVTVFEGNENAIKGLVEKQILSLTLDDFGQKVLAPHSPLLAAAFKDIIENDYAFFWAMERCSKINEIQREMAKVDKLENELAKLTKPLSQVQFNLYGSGIESRCKQINEELQLLVLTLSKKKAELSLPENRISKLLLHPVLAPIKGEL